MGRKKTRSKESRSRGKMSKDNRSYEESRIREAKEERKDRAAEEKAIVPIGVYPRLTYPFLSARPSVDDEEDEEEEEEDEEEEGVELCVRPRFVFVSSLCAVCSEKRRLYCDGCRMVSYCSKAHRSKGLAEHRELCEALNEIRRSIATTLSNESSTRLDPEQYRAYRVRLLGVLESKIRRPLKLWETEIVLYPTVCRSCRRFSEHLVCCANCGMECYCEEHATSHEIWCKEFRTLQRCLLLQHQHGSVIPKIPNVRRTIDVARTDLDFDQLMVRVYGNDRYYREMDCYTYSVLSHVCTIPLTALYATQISCPVWSKKTDWTIHVVGAEFHFEGINLHVWEKMFLHFIPNLKRLLVVLIGPELKLPSGLPAEVLSKVKHCRECKSTDRTVIVRFQPETLYHELSSDSRRKSEIGEADLICIFNPGLYRKTGFAGQDSWRETIEEFCGRSTPVAITSYTVDEMHWEIARLKSISDVEVLLEPRRNPFASIKPDRNFVTDHSNPLIYKNYYVTVVRGKPSSS